MDCPHCQNNEISASGVCLVCGHQVTAGNSVPVSESGSRSNEIFPGKIKRGYSKAAAEPSLEEELPQWRKELSQRLQEIKQKKEADAATEKQAESKSATLSAPQNRAAERPDAGPMRLVEKPLVRKAVQMPRKPPPRQKPLELVNQESTAPKPAPETAGRDQIETLIDKAVSLQATTMRIPVPIAETPSSAPKPFRNGPRPFKNEGRLIFLSRTLSGLIDLICVVLFVGIFIIAADRFGGIIVLDAASLVGFSALFLLTYFVYSIFFLSASSQTIGMMITDLRVIGIRGDRPSLSQFLKRCWWHLICLLMLGIGLLWGLLDRDSLCLHDRLSGTRVIRS